MSGDTVRLHRRYEEPIGLAATSARSGESVEVYITGHGGLYVFKAAEDIATGEMVALDFGFWTWLIGGTRQALAAWLRKQAQRLDYRP